MRQLIHVFTTFLAVISIVTLHIIPTSAGELTKDPILRIETEMHTSSIYRMSIDRENRYLVTGTTDKTVRVWELSTGRLIKVLRPPIAVGIEGWIWTVAISPDGETVACSGWTKAAEPHFNIYLFDRESGKLVRRITGFPDAVNYLTYSRDGRFLVATLKSKGIRIYRTSDYSLVSEDKDYGSESRWADFDINGRLVTTSYDGFIRLYDKSFKQIEKRKAPGGNIPHTASFSPDGSRIAIGFNDSQEVNILSGKDLSHLYTQTVGIGNPRGVCWSSDGRFLYASNWGLRGPFVIRKWADEGRGRYSNIHAGKNHPSDGRSIIDCMLPLRNGGIVFVNRAPSFGILDKNDKLVLYKGPSTAHYGGDPGGLLISHDGSAIQFGFDGINKSPARFSIINRQMDLIGFGFSVTQPESLSPPISFAEGMDITDWQVSFKPKLNGEPLKLTENEVCFSRAITPDRKNFLLGTSHFLRLFDNNGNERWRIPVHIARAVNISGNGKFVVAALQDGTIRWYRTDNGKELLAFFPHNDKKRWVAWTPSGYYDASPGAEELIGWHINNGKDREADFFSVSRFRGIYYRPEVVAKVLDTLNENEAVRLANEETGKKTQDVSIHKILPPIVTIISPKDEVEVKTVEITLKFTVRSPSGEPVTGIKILIDGRPFSPQRGTPLPGQEKDAREMKVIIPEKDSEVSVIAENRYAVSEPATVRLKWRGESGLLMSKTVDGALRQSVEFVIKPKLYILAIGVSEYEDKGLKLGFASKDAKDFTDTMLKQKGGLYRDVVAKLLTDNKATRDEILDGLDWITKETTSKDVAMVFLAGHGVNDPGGIYYFLPVNANTEKLKRTGIAFSDIKNTVVSLAGKTILFVDTCHSGNVMGTRRGVADINMVVNELASAENGAVVFSSSTGRQYSIEDAAWKNGAFTKALVEGVNGEADYKRTGKITINMLDLYISEKVKELTKGKQTPTTAKPNTVPDFPVALKR